MHVAGSSRQAREVVRSAARKSTADRPPSWRTVLATTLSLWASRRLSRFPRPRGRLAILAAAVPVVAVIVAVVAIVEFTGTSSPAVHSSSPGAPHRAGAARGGSSGAATAVPSQAAAWVASEVSGNQRIACDPVMCAALRARGVPGARLRPAAGSSRAGVAVGRRVSAQDMPVLLASFGSGAGRIEVRAASPGGAAAYQRALRAELAARGNAGAQLLRSRRVQGGAQAAGQLRAGQVDARVLVTLAALASQRPWRVAGFGDASPGDRAPLAQAPFRQVTIARADGRGGAAGLAAALALVRAQRAPYQPAQVTIVALAAGRVGLRISFSAPSPLGLLTGGGTR